MTAERPTFSPFWHRVRALTPRLRPHTQITRQHYRGRRWHVVHDPATNQYYRLSPVAHEFVGLFDGKRSVEEIWQIVLGKHGDLAPTQGEVIQLISQLHNANLLHADVSPETEQLLARGKERQAKKVKQQLIGLMYFRVKLFNPDRYLSLIEPILRPILNRWGFLAWLAFLIFAASQVLPEWDLLQEGFGSAISPANWGWMTVVFIVVKLIHETGHGVICKRFGGQVPELGVMMLVLVPAPYVDASACWAFNDKWKRIAVGAGGMIFELFVASIAALVWANSTPGQLLHQLAYNAMLTASVSTVLFNANPLMRFDGYYILSDLLEIPNLMQRSTNLLKHYAKTIIYRIKDSTPPTSIVSEQWIMGIYGVLAMIYRVFLFFSITLYVMGQMFAIGLFLAIWTAAAWFILPLGSFIHWLATHQSLAEFRTRAIATSLALVAAGFLLFGAVPWPDHRRGIGVIESPAQTGLFFGVDGFVRTVHARPGERVLKGAPVVTCESPELEAQLAVVRAMRDDAEAAERQARMKNPAAAQVAEERVRAFTDQERLLRERVEKLIVRAPHDGVLVGIDPAKFLGGYVKAGSPAGELVDDHGLRIAATLSQSEASWLFELPRDKYDVELRLVSRVDQIVTGGAVRVVEAAQKKLPHASLGFAGGGEYEVAAEDKSGTESKRALFELTVQPTISEDALASSMWNGLPGERVHLRFTLPDKPLLWQWLDHLQKTLQGRAQL
jgi:putative peptide zinc metalloprotease protein